MKITEGLGRALFFVVGAPKSGTTWVQLMLNGHAAIDWAGRHGGWVLDRVYSGKGLSAVLSRATAGEWGPGDDVVFVHTGGTPTVFTAGGDTVQR